MAQVLEPNSGQDLWTVVLSSHKKVISISSMFHRSLLDTQLSPHFSTPFPTLALGSYPSASPSTAPLQGGLCFGRLAEQSPLTGSEPESPIEVSSEHTTIYLREKAVPTRTLTISRPLWMRLKYATQQTWDGWLHYCFSQEREVVLFHSVFLQAWRNPCGTLSRFQVSGNH